jgi:hypothetical protein
MKYQLQVLQTPSGEPAPGLSVRVRKQSDNTTMTSLVADDDGTITYQDNGHEVPFYFETSGHAGAARIWSSDDAMTAGTISLPEIPIALSALGDGVVQNFLEDLLVGVSGDTITVHTGAGLVAGYPVVVYTDELLAISRPASGTRIDRVVLRVYPWGSSTTPGKAEVAILAGTDVAPTLTQSADVHEVSLAQLSVPSIGTVTVTDERIYVLAAFWQRPAPVQDTVRVSSASAASEGAIFSGLSVDLDLDLDATYDVYATLSGFVDTDNSPLFSHEIPTTMTYPYSVAVYGVNLFVSENYYNQVRWFVNEGDNGALLSNKHYITDCIVYEDSIILVRRNAASTSSIIERWELATSTQEWSITVTKGATRVACNGTYVYWINETNNTINRRLFSTGATSGTTSIAFGAPRGICANPPSGKIHVIDVLGNVYTYNSGMGSTGDPAFSTLSENPTYLALVDNSSSPPGARVAITDQDSELIYVYDGDEFLHSFGGHISEGGHLQSPFGVAVDGSGDFYVVDYSIGKVSKWTYQDIGYGDVAIVLTSSGGSSAMHTGERGLGNMSGQLVVPGHSVVTGPDTITVDARGYPTVDSVLLRNAVLNAKAVARR